MHRHIIVAAVAVAVIPVVGAGTWAALDARSSADAVSMSAVDTEAAR
ncbi:MAG TPA: hypothetical protein VNJ03_14920 [Vicinamibacterales bacterium]|nr:hypothetical protein [Vicinamibacterales bacterium]